MSPRARRIAFGLLVAAVTIVLALLYRKLAWNSPDSTLSWVRGGTTYVLRSPKLIGVLLVTPVLLLILPRSLADLPWQQQLLSLGFRVAFVFGILLAVINRGDWTLLAIALAGMAILVIAYWRDCRKPRRTP